MTYTPIPTGSANWDAPLNAALTTLDNTTTSNASRITALEATPVTKTGAVAGSVAYAGLVSGDTFDRFRIYADGKLEWGSGSAARDTNLYRNAVGSLQTDGFLGMNAGQVSQAFTTFTGAAKAFICGTSGGGLAVKEGTNGRSGAVALVGGTATVAHGNVTAITRIFLTSQVDGGAVGFLRTSARVAGTSFTITSSSATDTSTVAYLLVEPA